MVQVDETDAGTGTTSGERETLPRPLTDKQARFVKAYLGEAGRDATHAARLAGYEVPHKSGPELLKVAKVRRHLSPEMSEGLPDGRQPLARESPALDDRYDAFVMAYTGDAKFNATKAALAAGYSGAGGVTRLLQRPAIRARIDARMAEMSMSGQEVLAELTEVARRDLSECIEVRTTSKGVVTARMDASAKMKALELLGKAHGLFAERVHHSGSIRREYVIVNDPDGE